MSELEILQERYELALERIREIPGEMLGNEALEDYFAKMVEFLLKIEETRIFVEEGGLQAASLEELANRNHALYADILPENYHTSYGNPTYAVQRLGEGFGKELCALYAEMRRMIGFVHRFAMEELVIRMELFVEVYGIFRMAYAEEKCLPKEKDIKEVMYWFYSDYAEVMTDRQIQEMVDPEGSFAVKIICDSNLDDPRYLYRYGLYVTENELKMADFMSSLPEETIHTMADTYTEGYRIGFEATGKDLSIKKTAGLYYNLGFERMMRRSVANFADMNLASVVNPANVGSTSPNRQYEYDHKDDKALYLDKNYVNRKLEVTRVAYEHRKELAKGYAGPAVVETFGEEDFQPQNKVQAWSLTEEQNDLWVKYITKSGALTREYIPAEERSFTIIAFPVPQIGPVFEELFEETIRINTLDYMLYRNVQQNLIDALDTAKYIEIKGYNGNKTDLQVQLHTLADPAKETLFENCVADVNIPVGEVFTSPKLKGTNGKLHVTKVFLNGLEYRDLEIDFADGFIADYTCANFETEEENKKFVKENVLFRHETLPLGEFAIGTNTVAYVVAKRLGVEAKLPILIAEKMGPHFAVGDTCYSHEEDIRVYNPDGKEIVARSNEAADLRNTEPDKAYFNCHTDITIPYDELQELTAVAEDGQRLVIIKEGRFVLPGCEELNKAFEE